MATFGEYTPSVVTRDSPCWIPGLQLCKHSSYYTFPKLANIYVTQHYCISALGVPDSTAEDYTAEDYTAEDSTAELYLTATYPTACVP